MDPDFSDENYGVYVSTTDTAIANFTSVYEGVSPAEWEERTVNFGPEYHNKTIYIAFRHYNTTDQFRIKMDDIEVKAAPTDPTIEVVSNLDFGVMLVNETKIMHASVNGYNLTGDITLSTAAPFSLSSDNVTFSTTTTLPAEGGDLYVKYAPTEGGTHTDNITLSATGVEDVTISLTGEGIDCSTHITLPYEQGFEIEGELPICYTIEDADGDGLSWMQMTDPDLHHNGSGLAVSFSSLMFGILAVDNWMILPAFTVNNNATTLSFWAGGFESVEKYDVLISTSGTAIEDFNSVLSVTTPPEESYVQQTVDLSSYVGQSINIAFRHYDIQDEAVALFLDDITIDETGGGNGVAEVENHVNVYPNPAHNMLNISANGNIENIAIYDLTGAQVRFYNGNGYNTQISVSNLANGMYFLKIKTDNGMITKKVNVVK